jgi:hypothetical protein
MPGNKPESLQRAFRFFVGIEFNLPALFYKSIFQPFSTLIPLFQLPKNPYLWQEVFAAEQG